jgi:hypothetical protein
MTQRSITSLPWLRSLALCTLLTSGMANANPALWDELEGGAAEPPARLSLSTAFASSIAWLQDIGTELNAELGNELPRVAHFNRRLGETLTSARISVRAPARTTQPDLFSAVQLDAPTTETDVYPVFGGAMVEVTFRY